MQRVAGLAAAVEAWALMDRLPMRRPSPKRDEASAETPRLLLGSLDGSGDNPNTL